MEDTEQTESTEVESQPEPQPEAQAQDQRPEPAPEQPAPRRQHFIPKYRFDEVNTKYQQYKSLGDFDEVKAKLERLAALEQQPQNRFNEDRKRQIREDLLTVMPELRSLLDSSKNQTEAFIRSGVSQNETFLKELGLEVNEENNQYLQELIGGFIAKRPDLSSRFYARDPSVFADAWKEVKARFWPNLGRKVPGLSKTQVKQPTKPGPVPKPKPAEPKDVKPGPLMERELLDDASERAFAMLESQME